MIYHQSFYTVFIFPLIYIKIHAILITLINKINVSHNFIVRNCYVNLKKKLSHSRME